jgi:hypothetical protein
VVAASLETHTSPPPPLPTHRRCEQLHCTFDCGDQIRSSPLAPLLLDELLEQWKLTELTAALSTAPEPALLENRHELNETSSEDEGEVQLSCTPLPPH